MDSIFDHLAARRSQLFFLYGGWVLFVMLGAVGLAMSETYKLDVSESDAIPTLLGLMVGALVVHWVALYGTGPLAPNGLLHDLDDRLMQGALRGWSKLVVLGRWVFTLPALALQGAVQIAVLGFSYLALAARIGDNVTAQRSLSDGFEVLDVGLVLLGAGFVACALLVLILVVRYPRVRALLYSHLLIAAFALYGLCVLSATLYLNMAVFQGGKGDLLWWLLFPAVQLVFSGGALLRLCFGNTVELPCSREVGDLPTKSDQFDGSTSLSSARVLATAMLAVSYVAIDVSTEMASDMGKLGHTRSLAAAMVSEELQQQEADTDAKRDKLVRHPMGTARRVQRQSRGGLFSSSRAEIIEVTTRDGKVWRAKPATVDLQRDKASKIPDTSDAPEAPDAARKWLTSQLDSMARGMGLKLDTKNADFYALFAEVEQKLNDVKQVSIPLVGLQVKAGHAAWILSVIAFLLLVLIRSRVHRVFIDTALARDEPWLILDAGRFWERATAYAWLMILLSAALITHLGVLVIMGAQIPAEGGVTSPIYEIVIFGATFVIFLVSSLVAIDVARHLLTLRRLREAAGV